MIETKDIYWLAGLLEGEGSFTNQSGHGFCPRITIAMTDLDAVQRCAKILGGETKISEHKLKSGKTSYMFGVHGDLAIQWMITIQGIMCNRRREKIQEIIKEWESWHDPKSSTKRKEVKRKNRETDKIVNKRAWELTRVYTHMTLTQCRELAMKEIID